MEISRSDILPVPVPMSSFPINTLNWGTLSASNHPSSFPSEVVFNLCVIETTVLFLQRGPDISFHLKSQTFEDGVLVETATTTLSCVSETKRAVYSEPWLSGFCHLALNTTGGIIQGC